MSEIVVRPIEPAVPDRNVVKGRVATALLAALTLAACSGGGSPSTAPATGSLTITIASPSGVTPSVTVTGPGGFRRSVPGTTTLAGLTPGSYAVTATPVMVGNSIVASAYTATPTGSPAEVSAGSTATVDVSYAQQSGTGELWIGNNNGSSVIGLAAAQLGASTTSPAGILLGADSPNFSLAFDSTGNLWISHYVDNTITELTSAQLATSSTQTPAVTIETGTGFDNAPTGIAFDARGNLWASKNGSQLVAFTASQLTASGSPAPAITLTTGAVLLPNAIAFDHAGNLWVVSSAPAEQIAEFSAAQLTASGTPSPVVTLSDTVGHSVELGRLAFDARGDLWATSFDDSTVVEFTPDQLAAGGIATPAVTLSRDASRSLAGPLGVAFDASGNLWVGNGAGNSVVEIPAGQLASSGPAVPAVKLTGGPLAGPAALAFNPSATALPLRALRPRESKRLERKN